MFMRRRFRPRLRPQTAVIAAVGASIVLLATACGSSGGGTGSSGTGHATSGGTATFALPPDATPDWIFPLGTPGHLASYNGSIQAEMYLPLYNYDTASGTLALDPAISAAKQPVYSNGDKTVTITLQNLTWSNGQKLTSRDVQFWYDLVKFNKTKWGAYAPGDMPDDVTSFKIINSTTFQLGLSHAFNPGWFTANQLSLITPLPQAAWDVESAGGKVGNYDLTKAGAQQVFTYLTGASGKIDDYDSSPLWKVTDGPFKLQTWNTSGQVTLARSASYHGQDAARLDSVEFQPYTSDQAEFNVLRSGGVDYGYIPISDISQEKALQQDGYQIEPWVGWAVSYIPFNFNNPALGPVFKQLYVRQALQYAVNQQAIATDIWHGEATQGYGPIPQTPASSFLSPVQKANPYPYSLSKASALLKEHGWTEHSGQAATCTSPGTGASDCGAGIARGTKLALTILSESGSTETTNMMQELQSSFEQIGATLSIRQEPLDSVLNDSAICKPSQAACSWQLSFFGTQGSWYYPAYPSGEQIFASDAGVNLGSYDSPEADKLIQATNTSGSASAMQAYSAYLARNLPVLWVPNPDYQVSAIKNTLKGVLQNPLAVMNPQQWYLTTGS
jgi:peptide/nickel transport system substrate-binding protein